MESDDFDAYLIVLSDDGLEVTSADDGRDGLNARLEFRAPATGTYTILATTAAEGETGGYRVRLDVGGVVSMNEGQSVGWSPACKCPHGSEPGKMNSMPVAFRATRDNPAREYECP